MDLDGLLNLFRFLSEPFNDEGTKILSRCITRFNSLYYQGDLGTYVQFIYSIVNVKLKLVHCYINLGIIK